MADTCGRTAVTTTPGHPEHGTVRSDCPGAGVSLASLSTESRVSPRSVQLPGRRAGPCSAAGRRSQQTAASLCAWSVGIDPAHRAAVGTRSGPLGHPFPWESALPEGQGWLPGPGLLASGRDHHLLPPTPAFSVRSSWHNQHKLTFLTALNLEASLFKYLPLHN